MKSINKAKNGRSKINHNSSFKAKFCLCFKPVSSVDDDDAAFEPSSSLSTILSSALMADCRKRTDGWRRSSKKKVYDNDTCFWQILKKAFNKTTLVKKIKTSKAANKSKISRSTIDIIKLEKNSKQECKISRSPLESSNSSLFTRSSLSSSTISSSSSQQALGSSSSPSSSTTTFSFATPNIIRDKKKGTNPDDDDDRTKALCYILVTSLLILILWGKFFAIIFISFWLYLLPRRSEPNEPPGPAYKVEEEFDTVEYKKKIIMEGLLDRNRSRMMTMDSAIFTSRSCA